MTKQEKQFLLLEYNQWMEAMARRYGCTTNDVGKIVREYERKFEKLENKT